jgi:PhnB protein
MQIQPYLFFNGRCEEALNFYRSALGAEVRMLMRYKDAPEQPPPGMLPPNSGEKIMHSELSIGGAELMASDGCDFGKPPVFEGICLSLSLDSDDKVRRAYDALAAGGQVTMPLGKTFFASSFGMVKDRFGVHWMIIHS